MKKNTGDKPKYQACYEDYKGHKLFTVHHPKHREIVVRAPDENAAIVAAGKYWGTPWTKYDFYAYCRVVKC